MNPFESIQKQENKFQYTSVERVIEMIHRDYKYIPQLNISDIIEWVGDVYGNINYPGMFRHKVTGESVWTPNIIVTSYRGELPLDYKRVLPGGIRDYDTKEVYRPTTGTFTKFTHALNEDPYYKNSDKVYEIRGGYIFVEDSTCTLEMAYEAFPIDDRGYPLLPDDQKVLEYARDFVAEKVAFNLMAANKLSRDIWDIIDKRRMFHAGSAHTSLLNPTQEKMESWTWMRLKLMYRFGHDSSFSYQGNKEDLTLGTNT